MVLFKVLKLKNLDVKRPFSRPWCPKTNFYVFHCFRQKKYGKMICHMTWLYPKSSKLQSLSELDSARALLTYFRPKLEIFNTAFYWYIHFWTFHIILRRTSTNNPMLWAIVWEIASSYGLMTSSLLIRHFSQTSAKISRGLGAKFL